MYTATDDEDDDDLGDDNIINLMVVCCLERDSSKFKPSAVLLALVPISVSSLQPNFEPAADRDRNNVYNVTVIVTDSDGNTDALYRYHHNLINVEETAEVPVVLLFADVRTETLMQQAEVGTPITSYTEQTLTRVSE